MARRHGGDHDAYTFDLEPEGDPDNGPDGDEGLAGVPVSRTAHPARPRRGDGRRWFARGPRPTSERNLLIDLDVAPDPDGGGDLSPGGSSGSAAPPPHGARPGGLALVRRLQELLRGRRLVAAVVLVAVALTAVVVDTVSDRSRIASVRVSPGGVIDLSTPPREVWRHDSDGTSAPDSLLGGFAAMEGGLVVTLVDRELQGVDVEDGDVRWRVGLPEGATSCGPGIDPWSGNLQTTEGSQVVCVTVPAGRDARATVSVVDSAGDLTASRELDGSHDHVSPGPDGGVVVADWAGDVTDLDQMLAGPTADDLMEGSARLRDGYDLVVRLEDAETGERRWRRTLPFDGTTDPSSCVRWSEDGLEAQVDLRGGVQALVRGEATWVGGCGIDAWLASGGARLDDEDDPGTFRGFRVESLPSGRYVATRDRLGQLDGAEPTDRLLDEDGRLLRTFDGRYLIPQSTDGGGGGVHLVRQDSDVVALDDDGEQLWSADVQASELPVRSGKVAVVVDARQTVHGLDLGTGEELWVRDDLFADLDTAAFSSGPNFVESAFTDGRLGAMVVTSYSDVPRVQWFAFDVMTGEDLWQLDLEPDDDWGTQFAVDGRLVRWTPTAIVGLG